MPENDTFWDFYWESHLQPMENLGKRSAILSTSALIRRLAGQTDQPLRLLELGCGEGQVIGSLLEAHSQVCSLAGSLGVDYNAQFLAQCQRDYPGLPTIEGDFTDPDLLSGLGKFDVLLLVNALHEVFSDCFSPELGQIELPAAKLGVELALALAVDYLEPGGWLVLFDGLEPPGNPLSSVRIRFRDGGVRQDFETFVREYRPLRISYRQLEALTVELSWRDFTRYITKSIFLGKKLWQSERLQSYQYFTEEDYRVVFQRQGLEITSLQTLTVNEEKWRNLVEIESPAVSFPEEHILILARREIQPF